MFYKPITFSIHPTTKSLKIAGDKDSIEMKKLLHLLGDAEEVVNSSGMRFSVFHTRSTVDFHTKTFNEVVKQVSFYPIKTSEINTEEQISKQTDILQEDFIIYLHK